LIDRYFHLTENHTSVKQELLGGLTTFITMAYIVVVNPQILAQAGMPADGVMFATCLSAAVATLVMGLYANYPIALAPGMSLNAYFTYSVCLSMHVSSRTSFSMSLRMFSIPQWCAFNSMFTHGCPGRPTRVKSTRALMSEVPF
jgi:AGZA family xanthine/uracil permease-like MFS transporter